MYDLSYYNRNIRILKILEETFLLKDRYILENLKISYKTLQNDIKELNLLLENCAYIKYENSNCSLYIMNFEKYIEIKSKIYNDSINFDSNKIRMLYIYKKLSKSKENIIIDDLAEEMYISRTTLNNDIKNLNKILENYDLKIVGKPNIGIKLEGYEKNKRIFILENMYDYYYEDDIFDNEDNNKISNLFLKYNLGIWQKNDFIKYLTLALDRFSNDFFLEFEKGQYDELLEYYILDFVNEIFEYIYDKYRILLNNDEKKFIIIYFITIRTPIDIEKIGFKLEERYEYEKIACEILEKVFCEYGLKIDISEIIQEFLYHIYFLMQRLKYGVSCRNDMKDMIKEKYTLSYKIAESVSTLFEQNYGCTISDYEISYLALYFEVYIEKNNYNNIKILLITDASPALKNLIINDMINKLGRDVFVSVSTEFNQNINADADVIISTKNDIYDTNVPVIYQSEILDYEYIKKEIDLIQYMDKLKIRGINSILFNLIKEDTFFVLDENKTYLENTEMMLFNIKKYVDDKFIENIINKIKEYPVVFDKNVAFPHSVCKDTFLVAMGVSKNGFIDDRDIKLIFLVAIPEKSEQSKILLKMYNELIHIIKDKSLIEKLSKVKNYSDVIKYFIENIY